MHVLLVRSKELSLSVARSVKALPYPKYRRMVVVTSCEPSIAAANFALYHNLEGRYAGTKNVQSNRNAPRPILF